MTTITFLLVFIFGAQGWVSSSPIEAESQEHCLIKRDQLVGLAIRSAPVIDDAYAVRTRCVTFMVPVYEDV